MSPFWGSNRWADSKIYKEKQKIENSQNKFENTTKSCSISKTGRLSPSNFEIYRATESKQCGYLWKERHNQWIWTEVPEVDLRIHSQMISDNSSIQRRKDRPFKKWPWNTCSSTCNKKWNWNVPYTAYETELEMDHLNVEPKMMKLPEENLGETSSWSWQRYHRTQKEKSIKRTRAKLVFNK